MYHILHVSHIFSNSSLCLAQLLPKLYVREEIGLLHMFAFVRYKKRTKHYGLGVKHGLMYKLRTADQIRPTDYSPCFVLNGRN